MSIWEYADGRRSKSGAGANLETLCIYCSTPLYRAREDEREAATYDFIH
jgi:hypothetical protein